MCRSLYTVCMIASCLSCRTLYRAFPHDMWGSFRKRALHILLEMPYKETYTV